LIVRFVHPAEEIRKIVETFRTIVENLFAPVFPVRIQT